MKTISIVLLFSILIVVCPSVLGQSTFSINLEKGLQAVNTGNSGHKAPLILFDFEGDFNLDAIEATKMEAILVGESGSRRLLLKAFPDDRSAAIVLKNLDGSWDLNGYRTVKMDITNTHDKPIQLIMQVGDPEDSFERWQMQEVVDLEPGETKTVTNAITVTKWLFAQPLDLVGMFGPPGQVKSDLGAIGEIKITTRYAKGPHSFEIDNIRADEPIAYIDTAGFLPFVDQFGQFKHTEWPGKIHSVEDLVQKKIEEEKELAENPEPPNRSIYGGWAAGPKLEATGFFRTEKYENVWWLVDPEGYLFWSNGVNCVHTYCGATGVSGRDTYFEDLPDKEGPFGEFYSRRRGGSRNFYLEYGAHDTYNFSGSNLKYKYGDNWSEEFNRMAHARLRSWGMNTLANVSRKELCAEDKTPYVSGIWIRGSKKIEASSGYQGKFHDVFDPGFRQAIRRSLSSQSFERTDPWCLGFFIDNELSWGGDGSLSVAALESPADQAAKQEFVADLRAKYGSIKKLNSVWGSTYESWEDMLQRQEKPDEVKAREDLNQFYEKIAITYFSSVRDEMKAIAPDIMYLGCRLAWANSDIVVRTAAKYCDVISKNKYEYAVDNITLPEGVDKPVLIGEYHFGALDRGLFHVGIKSADSQKDRGAHFSHYVESALGHPNIVGAHWFQYGDQAVTGRGDGENYNVGLVSICDTPFEELISAIRKTSYPLYEYRSTHAK